MMGESWPLPNQTQGQVKQLNGLGVSTKPDVKLHNRFGILSATDEEPAERTQEPPNVKNIVSTGKAFVNNKVEKTSPRKFHDKSNDTKLAKLGGLAVFTTIEPESINATTEAELEWQMLTMAVDSGASETVMAETDLPGVPTEPGAASRRGVKYEVANGHQIPNLGEKKFEGVTDLGLKRGITAQVCSVNKPLLSVSKLVKAGHRVVFEPDGAYIQDLETEEHHPLEESGGMYHVCMWVHAPKAVAKGF